MASAAGRHGGDRSGKTVGATTVLTAGAMDANLPGVRHESIDLTVEAEPGTLASVAVTTT
jgi:hypothetical protein